MRTFTSPIQVARLALMQDRAWLLFVEVPTKSGGFFRIVRSKRHQVQDGKLWQACELGVELPEEDAQGTLGEMELTIPNVSRLPMSYLEIDGELLGQRVSVWLALEGQPFSPAGKWEHVALSGSARERTVRIRCGHPAESSQVPTRRFDRQNFPSLLPAGLLV
jgi:hypothetical protein